MQKEKLDIPSFDLIYKDEKVSFAIRSMSSIEDENSGKIIPPHRHNYFSILFIKSAIGKHQIDFVEYDINPKSIIFINPGQVHSVQINGKPDGYAILFTQEFMYNNGISQDFINNLRIFKSCDENPPIGIPNDQLDYFNQIIEKIIEEFYSDDSHKYEMISSQLKIFLIQCNRLIKTKSEIFDTAIGSDISIVSKFKNLVEQNFTNLHKVNEYAEQLFVTANYLNEVIKAGIGKTAKEYIQDRIILEAKRKVHYTDLTSKEIAYELGYNDPAHFSKVFKNCTNQSFSSYKNSIRKKYN